MYLQNKLLHILILSASLLSQTHYITSSFHSVLLTHLLTSTPPLQTIDDVCAAISLKSAVPISERASDCEIGSSELGFRVIK